MQLPDRGHRKDQQREIDHHANDTSRDGEIRELVIVPREYRIHQILTRPRTG
jgi:hypothetical protein